MKFNKGSIVTVAAFAFDNKAGGTGMSNWQYDPKFKGTAKVLITKEWDDYETGQHGIGTPIQQDKKLIKYLYDNAKNYNVYVSEFDVVAIRAQKTKQERKR
ncbi:MAG: hypothetical protein WC346_20145 [Methanogenium sp.]|jgi:hypothetical protein